jgi:hypothetical protein
VPTPGTVPDGRAGVETPAREPHPEAADPAEATDPVVRSNPPGADPAAEDPVAKMPARADPAAEDPDKRSLSNEDAGPETGESDEGPPAEAEDEPAGNPEEPAGPAEEVNGETEEPAEGGDETAGVGDQARDCERQRGSRLAPTSAPMTAAIIANQATQASCAVH